MKSTALAISAAAVLMPELVQNEWGVDMERLKLEALRPEDAVCTMFLGSNINKLVEHHKKFNLLPLRRADTARPLQINSV